MKLAGLVDVLPLDDPQHLEEGGFLDRGRVRIDPEALKARHAAQDKRLACYGAFSLVVLGASHDLTGVLDGETEYVRVFTRTVWDQFENDP